MFDLITNIIAPTFYKLLYMSLTATIIGLVIVIIRRLLDKQFSPAWKYFMWILVLIPLLLPWRPQSKVSVMNKTEAIRDISFSSDYNSARIEYEKIINNEKAQSNHEVPVLPDYPAGKIITNKQISEIKSEVDSLHIKTLIFDVIIPIIWLVGLIIMVLFIFMSFIILNRQINKSTITLNNSKLNNILELCKQKTVIRRNVKIIIQNHVKTPVLFGVFRPKIILPDYVNDLDDKQLEHIILHELSHLKRGDGLANMLLIILQTIYWFNPITYYLFKCFREDMEIANDASVTKHMDTEEQKAYSLSLVEVLKCYNKPRLAPRMLCMVDNEKNMSRRINMIKLSGYFKKHKIVITITGIAILGIVSALFLTSGVLNKKENRDQNDLMTSLGYTYEMLEIIQKNKTAYVGDNSKVGAIVNCLPVYWNGLKYESLSLQTESKPYGITVNYKRIADDSLTDWYDNPFADAKRENNALLLFSSIDNLDKVTFIRLFDMQISTFTRDMIENHFGKIPLLDNEDEIYNMLSANLTMEEFYFAHAGRLLLGVSKPEDLLYRYGDIPYNLFINKANLTVYEYDIKEQENGNEYFRHNVNFYFNDTGLYGIKYNYSEASNNDNLESYSDIIKKFGVPQTEKTIDGNKLIMYELRKTKDEPDKYAFYIFKDNVEIESGWMYGNDISALSMEKSTENDVIESLRMPEKFANLVPGIDIKHTYSYPHWISKKGMFTDENEETVSFYLYHNTEDIYNPCYYMFIETGNDILVKKFAENEASSIGTIQIADLTGDGLDEVIVTMVAKFNPTFVLTASDKNPRVLFKNEYTTAYDFGLSGVCDSNFQAVIRNKHTGMEKKLDLSYLKAYYDEEAVFVGKEFEIQSDVDWSYTISKENSINMLKCSNSIMLYYSGERFIKDTIGTIDYYLLYDETIGGFKVVKCAFNSIID